MTAATNPEPANAHPAKPQADSTSRSFKMIDFSQWREKDIRTAIALAFAFGPIGLLYSTVLGGLSMTALTLLVVFLGPSWARYIVWFACVIWAWWENKD